MAAKKKPARRPTAPPTTAFVSPARARKRAALARRRAHDDAASPRPEALPPRAIPRWAASLLLAGLTVLPWVNAAPDALLVDDAGFPPEPASTLTLDGVLQYFREDAWASIRILTGVYRPLPLTLQRLESIVWGTAPHGYHITSIAAHVGVTLLLFAFLSELFRASLSLHPRPLLPEKARGGGEQDLEITATPPPPGASLREEGGGGWRHTDGAAWVAALAFGVHPIHTEAVDSIFNRAEVLAALGVVAALWLVVREMDRRPKFAWGGACALYLLALLCKESAVTLPALLALVLVLTRGDGPLTRQRFVPLATLLIPLAIYTVLRTSALGFGGDFTPQQGGLATGDGLLARIELTLTALRDFLRMMVWPSPLRVSYDDYTAHGVLLAVALQVALAGASVALWRRAPGVGVGLAMFDLALLPSTRLISHLGVVVTLAERYAYLPSIGCALALGAGLLALARRYGLGVYIVAAAPLYALLAPMTYARNVSWHSEIALWEAEVTVAPENVDGWKWLTAAYMNVGRWDAILRICDQQLPAHGGNPGFAINCGMAYDVGRRPVDAENALRRAAAAGPNSHVSLALARHLANGGRTDEARQAYEQAIAQEPDEVRQHTLRGEMYLSVYSDRRADAEAEYQAALAIEPRYDAARAGLARVRQGQ